MTKVNRRSLIIDDNGAIHQDFAKVLGFDEDPDPGFSALETELFGASEPRPNRERFEINSAYQGQEGIEKVVAAVAIGRPRAMAFVDLRMPPGLDGVETITHIREICRDLPTVICTAYSDYSNDEIIQRLGGSDRLLILRKPFDPDEVQQLTRTLAGRSNGPIKAGNANQ